jgi:hypothetical protein
VVRSTLCEKMSASVRSESQHGSGVRQGRARSGSRHVSCRRVNNPGESYAYILTDFDVVGDGRRGLSMGDLVGVFSILEVDVILLALNS